MSGRGIAEIGFVFMATRHDRTVPDARERVREALNAGVRNIGIKNIGVPQVELALIAQDVKSAEASLFLEIVSLDRESEIRSARVAVQLEVDFLLGGINFREVAEVVGASSIKYFPFCGEVVGHPSVLTGSIDSIVASARNLCEIPEVAGVDLLAYRFVGDVPALVREVTEAVTKPVLVAGSIDRLERIEEVLSSRAAGFTIGTAALDGVFPVARDLGHQLRFVSESVRRGDLLRTAGERS